jgi:hypothetical protein
MHKIKDYGLVEVEKLNGAVKVQIQFDNNLWWEGFVLKQDGTPNKKTIGTLFTCGFRGTDLIALLQGPQSGLLNMEKEFDLTVVTETYDDKEIQKVEWVNDPENPKGKQFATKIDSRKLGGAALGKLLNEMNQKNGGLKNHAPGFNESEEIPF